MKPLLDDDANSSSPDDDDDDTPESVGKTMGRGFVWCCINHTDLPIFLLSVLVMYLSVGSCLYCIVIVGMVSAILCTRFHILNATLWVSLEILWYHDWALSFGRLDVWWSQRTNH
jgi:hypothetical protein